VRETLVPWQALTGDSGQRRAQTSRPVIRHLIFGFERTTHYHHMDPSQSPSSRKGFASHCLPVTRLVTDTRARTHTHTHTQTERETEGGGDRQRHTLTESGRERGRQGGSRAACAACRSISWFCTLRAGGFVGGPMRLLAFPPTVQYGSAAAARFQPPAFAFSLAFAAHHTGGGLRCS
jgi:hypothetical protein